MRNSLKFILFTVILFTALAFAYHENETTPINAHSSITIYTDPDCANGYCRAISNATGLDIILPYNSGMGAYYTNSVSIENAPYTILVCCKGSSGVDSVDLTNNRHVIDTVAIFYTACLKGQ